MLSAFIPISHEKRRVSLVDSRFYLFSRKRPGMTGFAIELESTSNREGLGIERGSIMMAINQSGNWFSRSGKYLDSSPLKWGLLGCTKYPRSFRPAQFLSLQILDLPVWFPDSTSDVSLNFVYDADSCRSKRMETVRKYVESSGDPLNARGLLLWFKLNDGEFPGARVGRMPRRSWKTRISTHNRSIVNRVPFVVYSEISFRKCKTSSAVPGGTPKWTAGSPLTTIYSRSAQTILQPLPLCFHGLVDLKVLDPLGIGCLKTNCKKNVNQIQYRNQFMERAKSMNELEWYTWRNKEHDSK